MKNKTSVKYSRADDSIDIPLQQDPESNDSRLFSLEEPPAPRQRGGTRVHSKLPFGIPFCCGKSSRPSVDHKLRFKIIVSAAVFLFCAVMFFILIGVIVSTRKRPHGVVPRPTAGTSTISGSSTTEISSETTSFETSMTTNFTTTETTQFSNLTEETPVTSNGTSQESTRFSTASWSTSESAPTTSVGLNGTSSVPETSTSGKTSVDSTTTWNQSTAPTLTSKSAETTEQPLTTEESSPTKVATVTEPPLTTVTTEQPPLTTGKPPPTEVATSTEPSLTTETYSATAHTTENTSGTTAGATNSREDIVTTQQNTSAIISTSFLHSISTSSASSGSSPLHISTGIPTTPSMKGTTFNLSTEPSPSAGTLTSLTHTNASGFTEVGSTYFSDSTEI